MELIISFQGMDADDHRIEAYAGIESAAGIARALTLIAHFASTGKVRHRFPFSPDAQVFLEGTEEGSFNWRMVVQISGALALGMAGNALYDLTKSVIATALGESYEVSNSTVQSAMKSRSGDYDALVEAIEPALKKAHYGIGETATKIIIREKSEREVIIELDARSKSYLFDSADGGLSSQDVSVSSLNVNDRTGRAYFLDLRRTIPFRISRDAAPDTMSTISASLNSYANNQPAPIRLTFKRIEATDGRLKRVEVYRAEDVSDQD
ncbi:MAG: hypothetical protein O9283_06700 [Sphingomonadaceae bacterium]|nr:hypothetical protein [Sphingomonadaceae bacterium]